MSVGRGHDGFMTVGSVSGGVGGCCCCWLWWWSHGNHSATRSQLFIFFYYLFMTLARPGSGPGPDAGETCGFCFCVWTKDICVSPRNKSNKRANFYEHIIEKLPCCPGPHAVASDGSWVQGAWQLDQAYNCRRFFGPLWMSQSGDNLKSHIQHVSVSLNLCLSQSLCPFLSSVWRFANWVREFFSRLWHVMICNLTLDLNTIWANFACELKFWFR